MQPCDSPARCTDPEGRVSQVRSRRLSKNSPERTLLRLRCTSHESGKMPVDVGIGARRWHNQSCVLSEILKADNLFVMAGRKMVGERSAIRHASGECRGVHKNEFKRTISKGCAQARRFPSKSAELRIRQQRCEVVLKRLVGFPEFKNFEIRDILTFKQEPISNDTIRLNSLSCAFKHLSQPDSDSTAL